MATQILKKLTTTTTISTRHKTTSAAYVSSRVRDATFEMLMDKHKNLVKVISIQDLILANNDDRSISVDFLHRLSQKLRLNRGAAHFLRRYPRIFDVYYDASKSQPFCRLTPVALQICREESDAVVQCLPVAVDRLVRILSMSRTGTVPLRAVFKVWRELGLPDDFEETVIRRNEDVFRVVDNVDVPNTHLLKLVGSGGSGGELVAAVEDWRVLECCKEGDSGVNRMDVRFSFKQGFPPGMRLKKNFKAKVKEWQKVAYIGPYEAVSGEENRKLSKSFALSLEKRAVGIVHEFLSLTVEKMVEVEKISHFRKWFGIDLNIRDLFLDHPGIFYLSTKGKRHTVFLREAYERGCLIEPNPVYDARRKLLHLVAMGRRGFNPDDFNLSASEKKEDALDEMENQ